MPQCIRRVLLLLLYVRLRVLCSSRWSSCGKLHSEMRMERWLQIFSCSGSRGWWWCSHGYIVSVLFISRRHTDTGGFSPAVSYQVIQEHSATWISEVFSLFTCFRYISWVYLSLTCALVNMASFILDHWSVLRCNVLCLCETLFSPSADFFWTSLLWTVCPVCVCHLCAVGCLPFGEELL